MNDDATRSPSRSSDHTLTEDERRAHEVRTHLTVIVLRAQVLRRRLTAREMEAPELLASLDAIDLAAMHLRQEVERWEEADSDDHVDSG